MDNIISDNGRRQIACALEESLKALLPLEEEEMLVANIQRLLDFRLSCNYESSDEHTIEELKTLASSAVKIILNCNQPRLLPDLFKILKNTLLVLPANVSTDISEDLTEECLYVFGEEFLADENSEKTKTFVNLLEQLLKFCSDQNLELTSKLQVITSHLIFCTSENLSSYAISNLVPRLLCTNQEYITEIWHRLLLHINIDKTMDLGPLCLLMALILSSENPDVAFLQQEQLWLLIQRGLASQDQMARKQARFMLKRALDFIDSNKISISCNHFIWSPQASSLEMWNDFFLIMETLEEKQVHIIKPVLPLIEKLFGSIGPQWTLVALSQVICHANNHITKWGLEFFFSLSPSLHSSQFLVKNVMPALDNTQLFFESQLAEKLEMFVQKCAAMADTALFKQISPAIRSISWGPVPFFVVCKALGNLPSLKVWDSEDLNELKLLLSSAMSTQDVFLRATAQSMLLRAVLSLVDVRKITMEPWLDLIASFNRKESLARGLQDWQLLVEFICKNPEVQFNPSEFVFKVSSNAAARYVLLLSDAGLVENEKIDELATEFELSLQQLETRLYSISSRGKTHVDDLIELIVQIQTELNQESWESSILEKVLRPKSIQGIVGYVYLKLKSEQDEDPQLIRLYISSLRLLEVKGAARHIDAEKLISCACNILKSDEGSLLSKHFASKVVEHFFTSNRSVVSKPLKELIEKRALAGTLNNVQFSNWTATSEQREDRNKIMSSILTSNWRCLLAHLELCEPSNLPQETLLRLAEDAVEISGPETLPNVMHCLKHCLHLETDTHKVETLLNRCYLKCFEHRKSELFWMDIRAFIKLAFNAQMLKRSDLVDCLLRITDDLHEQSQIISGLFNLIIDNLCDLDVNEGIIFNHQLCLALLFGPVLRRDQKIQNEFSHQITELGCEIPANSLVGSNAQSSQYIRSKALKFPLLNKGDNNQVADFLIKKDLELRNNKKLRYFAESQVHRIKHRIAQSLLVISCSTANNELQSTIFEWATQSLADENHQPSVRFMIEWLLSLILLNNESFEAEFFKLIMEAASRRLNSIPSFVSVLYLWIVELSQIKSRRKDLLRLIESAIDLMLPWCMAQNYNIRLYAQVALLRIFTVCERHGLEEHEPSFSILQRSVRSSVDQSSGVKNAIKLQEDFFFSVFDPIAHLSLETIFVEFPRLSNVGQDEWLPRSIFALGDDSRVKIKIANSDDSLANSKVASWILKATGATSDSEAHDECLHSVVQRKVTPWRDMFPENSAREKRTPSLGGLVVVASLVDKAPNLGGLSRTCEIFGASELIIGNMKILDDIAFQSLSVTAEKWINLSEVKPESLIEYLQHMKRQGYQLMAAEQTSKSVPLQSVEFNKKSLLLLGNEKEGIPAELLPYLDVCVEIPQMGVIRSLNVHVTGALFIWQYFQQHHLAPDVLGKQ